MFRDEMPKSRAVQWECSSLILPVPVDAFRITQDVVGRQDVLYRRSEAQYEWKICPLLGGATEKAPSLHWLGLREVGTLAMDRIPQLDEDSIPISAHGLAWIATPRNRPNGTIWQVPDNRSTGGLVPSLPPEKFSRSSARRPVEPPASFFP